MLQQNTYHCQIDQVRMSSLIAKYHGSAESPSVDLSMKLFVGQVPKTMEESELQPYFQKYGPIMSVKICRDRDTKNHKGCAFVTFENLDHADEALHEMHDRVALPGAKKEMQIKPVHVEDEKKFEKRLFVGMISKSLAPPDLEDMFSKFGEITDCNILYSQDKSSRGCGFIKFEKPSSCLLAIKEVHHSQTMEGCNSPIVVKHADSPADKMKRQAGQGYDDRQSKRPFMQHGPGNFSQPPPPPPQFNQPPPPQQQNSTAMALINAFTPLLATVAEQNNPGTTKMLVKSIEIALNALQHENSPSAHTALVSIASNLSVAVANNLSRTQPQNTFNSAGYNAGDYNQYNTQDFQQYNTQYSSQGSSYSGSASYYGGNQQNGNSAHYNYSSRPN